ncbi:hypothetical protein ACL7TT_06950 [Microbulbifer sp. 2304DJ12-6]|uniref:hypothetical protein n=1 Tax=Microbulbifer sp. 2304DJ12-6 TaxID=3233340 RepID=UPI0039B05B5F
MKLPSSALQTAIENAYDTFARYPRSADISGCPCCVLEEDHKALNSAPLGELTSSDLERFVHKAMTTWGGDDDFKHFLPRILELIATDMPLAHYSEVIAGKLVYAEWHRWPEPEQNAVAVFLNAWWQWGRWEDAAQVETCLVTLACAGWNVSRQLSEWWNDDSPASRQCIIAFLVRQVDVLTQGESPSAFWGEEGTQVLKTWLDDVVQVPALLSLALEHPIDTDVYDLYTIASLRLGSSAADTWFEEYHDRHLTAV